VSTGGGEDDAEEEEPELCYNPVSARRSVQWAAMQIFGKVGNLGPNVDLILKIILKIREFNF
jgi:hypothetical protein